MFSRYCIIAFSMLFPFYANAGSYEDVFSDIAKRENVNVLEVKKTLGTACAEIDDKPKLWESCHRYAFVGSEIQQDKLIATMPKQRQQEINAEQTTWKKQRDETCSAEVNPDIRKDSYMWKIYFNSCREIATNNRTYKLKN